MLKQLVDSGLLIKKEITVPGKWFGRSIKVEYGLDQELYDFMIFQFKIEK